MLASTVTSKGQTTLPKPVRDRLQLEAGDRVEFLFEEDGRVVLMPATVSVRSLKGSLPKPARKVTVEDMNQAVRKRVAKKLGL